MKELRATSYELKKRLEVLFLWVFSYVARSASLVALSSLCLCAPVYADIPSTITYQGHVVDAEGAALSGPYDVTFRMYDSEEAQVGDEIWMETHAAVNFTNGDFRVSLGSVSAQSEEPLSDLPFDKPYWLGLTIANLGELLPHEPLEMVPFAYRVRDGVTLSEEQTVTGNKQFEGNVVFEGPAHFSAQATGNGAVPSGMIALFTISCPEDWTYFSELEGKFLVSGQNYNPAAGGSATHTHSLSDVPNGIGWNAGHGIGGVTGSNAAISTQVNAMTAEPASSLPPYATVMLCKKD